MQNAPSLLQLSPDIFFDVLAYILPASLLFIGVMMIPSSIGAPLVNAYLSLGASFDKFIVVLFGIGILYILGQLISNQWIGLIICAVLFLLFLHEAYGQQVFVSRYLQEMTKELRNMEPTQKKNKLIAFRNDHQGISHNCASPRFELPSKKRIAATSSS